MQQTILSHQQIQHKIERIAYQIYEANVYETEIIGHHFLKTPLKQLKTAVLVNRNHKKYPVKADYKGISLSTSLQEHVNVLFEPKNDRVFLD